MKRCISTRIIPAVLFLGLGASAFAYNGAYFDYFHVPYTMESAALGGLHAASAEGMESLLNNPAGFNTQEPAISLMQATIGLYDNAPLFIGEILSAEMSTSTQLRRSTFGLLGPLSFGFVGNGIGFGIFNNTVVRNWTWGAYPLGSEIVEEEIVLIAGYALGIPLPEDWHSTLDIGVSIPIFMVTRNYAADMRGILFAGSQPFDLIINEPFTSLQGVGLEAGVLYSFDRIFSIGIVGRSLAMTTRRSYSSLAGFLAGEVPTTVDVPLPLDVSAGIKWTIPLKEVLNIIDDLTLLLDYCNMFDFLIYPPGATNPLLHIGAGLEIRLFQILRLQAGYFQCLPSGGLSVDLSLFKLSMVVFGREATTAPWGYPVYGYALGLEF